MRHRYEVRDGVVTGPLIEICAECGKAPQAPAWDQCFGCGKAGTVRKFVQASDCIEYGVTFPVGVRLKDNTEGRLPSAQDLDAVMSEQQIAQSTAQKFRVVK